MNSIQLFDFRKPCGDRLSTKLISAIFVLVVSAGSAYSLSNAATSSEKPAAKPSVQQIIYSACLPTETRAMEEKGEKEPEAMAYYLCKIVAGICSKDLETDACKKDLKKYEAVLNEKGDSLLHKAAWIGDTRMVEAMINAGVDIDYSITGVVPSSPFGNGWTPLLIAAAEGNEEVVSVLIKRGANVNAKNKLGRTALMFASNYGFNSIAEMLLENGANANEVPNDNDGWSALMAASYKGHGDIVQLLLTHGANQNLQDKNGKTALVLAEEQRDTKVVKILKNFR